VSDVETAEIPLSPRMRLALEFAAEGHTAIGIAGQMSRALKVTITRPQAEDSLRYARLNLGALNTAHAVAIALRKGYIL